MTKNKKKTTKERNKKTFFTPKRHLFVKEYLVDCNGTQAAIRAGYSKKGAHVRGVYLLRNDTIKQEISKEIEKRALEIGIDAKWVLEHLQELVDRCMQKKSVMKFNRETKKMEQVKDEKGSDVYQFDSSGANRALELIGRHLNMFKESEDKKVDITVVVKDTFDKKKVKEEG